MADPGRTQSRQGQGRRARCIPDQAVNPGNLRSLLASPASRPESGKPAGAGAYIAVRPGGLPGHSEGLSERGPLRRSCPAGSIDRAHQASSTLMTAAPRLPSRRPAHRRGHHRACVRASYSGKLHRNRRGETLASCRQPESLNPGSAPGSTEKAPRSRGCPLATPPDRRTRRRPAPALTTSRR